jgi:23S rRNA pseudouridine1911/1915/1917 synthase
MGCQTANTAILYSPMLIITVPAEKAKMRLDHFLTENMEITRSQIQKIIKAGTITVNGETAKNKTVLETDDEISYPSKEDLAPGEKEPAPDLNIIFENDDLLVINKPAGLLVHDAMDIDIRSTVVDGLLKLYPEIASIGDDAKRPGIVHRLDKDVSGLMVIAKTQEAFEFLKEQFKERTITKEYLALVYGKIPHPVGEIKLQIARSKTKGRMVARTGDQEGKEAHTHYEVIKYNNTTTFARVKILTGRTHQIRVHFQALGNPLVGDKLYKIKKMRMNPIPLDRIFLHAQKLGFKLLDGEEKEFELPLPKQLEDFLKQR